MLNKHFFKTVLIFLMIIGLGLFSVYLINYWDEMNQDLNTNTVLNETE